MTAGKVIGVLDPVLRTFHWENEVKDVAGAHKVVSAGKYIKLNS